MIVRDFFIEFGIRIVYANEENKLSVISLVQLRKPRLKVYTKVQNINEFANLL